MINNVQFEEDNYKSNYFSEDEKSSSMIIFVRKISGGLLKSEKQANYFLFLVALIFLFITLFIFFDLFNGVDKPPKGLEGENVEIYDEQF